MSFIHPMLKGIVLSVLNLLSGLWAIRKVGQRQQHKPSFLHWLIINFDKLINGQLMEYRSLLIN